MLPTHFFNNVHTLKCSDLGVFIGAMDANGFAAKSGKLHVLDRVLACNGVDFTKERNNR